jgi:hypothetical protein
MVVTLFCMIAIFLEFWSDYLSPVLTFFMQAVDTKTYKLALDNRRCYERQDGKLFTLNLHIYEDVRDGNTVNFTYL